MRLCLIQEFNKGIFDYLIATDDPAKRLEQEEHLARKPAVQPEPAPTRGRGRGKDKADQRKRKRASENDSEFGVIRGIDFQGVTTVINVDVPDSVQVTLLHTQKGKRADAFPAVRRDAGLMHVLLERIGNFVQGTRTFCCYKTAEGRAQG